MSNPDNLLNFSTGVKPNLSSILNGVAGVLGVLAVASPKFFPSYIPEGVASDITETAGFVLAIWGGVNTGLHLTSSAQPGLLAPSADNSGK